MFAVVEISAQQFTVRASDTLTVPLLDAEVGSTIEFSNILLGGEESNITVGCPYISGSVTATILAHGKGDKVLVFKKNVVKVIVSSMAIASNIHRFKLMILNSDNTGVILWHIKKAPDLPGTAVTQIQATWH